MDMNYSSAEQESSPWKAIMTKKPVSDSVIPKHRKTIQALGLKKINSFNIHEDNDAIRGMVEQVKHLVKVEEVNA